MQLSIQHGPKDVDTTGGMNLPWGCLSPSTTDVETAKTRLSGQISRSMPSTLPTALIFELQRGAQETPTKPKQVERYIVSLGNIVATSGWRNVPFRVQPGPEPPVEMLMDWAMASMTPSHWADSASSIQGVAEHLDSDMELVPSHWKCQNLVVLMVAKQIKSGETVFKHGRSTGLTTGEFVKVAPASFRIPRVSQRLHHHCLIVASYSSGENLQ